MSDPVVPVACTLTTKAAAQQVMEWHDLVAAADSVERIPAGVRMALPVRLAGPAADLVAREQTCCAFLDVAIHEAGDHLTIEITSGNPDAAPVIDLIVGAGISD